MPGMQQLFQACEGRRQTADEAQISPSEFFSTEGKKEASMSYKLIQKQLHLLLLRPEQCLYCPVGLLI